MSTLFRVFSQFLRCHSWKNLWKIVSSIISKNQATAGTRPYLLSEQILMVNLSTLPKSWLRFQSLHLHNLLVHSVTFLVKEKNGLAPLYLTDFCSTRVTHTAHRGQWENVNMNKYQSWYISP